MSEEAKLVKELCNEVSFRQVQINLLYSLLVETNTILYPTFHLFGLSGTGKTFTIKKFMRKFCSNGDQKPNQHVSNQDAMVDRFYVYLNCNELCYASMSLLFNEVLIQIRSLLLEQNKQIGLELESDAEFLFEDDDTDTKINDCASFVRKLKNLLRKFLNHTNLFLVFDNAENLKYFPDASNLILTLSKLNEYINVDQYVETSGGTDELIERGKSVMVSSIFISEIDWHSFLSECDLMSKTEAPRPFKIHFNDYTKDEIYKILLSSAAKILSRNADSTTNSHKKKLSEIEFYARIILDVFFSVCKDLNELQYLIQIYYDQLLNSVETMRQSKDKEECTSSKDNMLIVWNKMKPFLKQALTQIYLRQSLFTSSTQSASKTKISDDILSKEFECLNLISNRSSMLSSEQRVLMDLNNSNESNKCHLPTLMKYLLVSSYIATHNPAKYDKKLFDYHSGGKSRKSKFTAQKIQQTEENQRAAALKTQSFDLNRLLAILVAICSEQGYAHTINLNLIQLNLKTLKSFHYIQQINSSYSSLDEPKFKCLLDFDTIQSISTQINFNIKQYLVEYLTF